ncbi:hypothetical protein [Pseudoroseomonas ludipueritiae]|uniref:Uncharacterized protein n=1 Tax=Pseudoroseomonas ludipueritiae TaxID=198093 RepID=A0ABR7RBH9_9PROT|nr:hypothetical protein [Pseudoroseomonas ludipueritiae]MBC9178847.1 hypothetical protein [Pseudoroseomonas ludipueritiae]
MPRPAPFLLSALGLAGLLAAFLSAAPAQAAGDQDGSFNLVNRSNRVIERLYASPLDSNDWGDNRLSSRGPLANGANLPVRMAPEGGCRTDLRIGFEGGLVEERRDIDTCQDRDVVIGTPERTGARQAQRQGGKGSDPSFTLRNEANSPVREIYASPSNEDDWGQDQLGRETLRAHGRRTIRLPSGECQYDLRIVWEDGRSEERRDVNLCATRELTFR